MKINYYKITKPLAIKSKIVNNSISLIIIFSSILGLQSLSINQSAYAQSSLNLNELGLDVQNPETKQDFVNQCSSALQAQGIPSQYSQSYCQCSANAVYKIASNSTDGTIPRQETLKAINNCAASINTDSSK